MWGLTAGMEELCRGFVLHFNAHSPSENKDMRITILTPLVIRIHAGISQTAQVIFIVTTNCIDQTNTSIILILTWSPVAADKFLTCAQSATQFSRRKTVAICRMLELPVAVFST